MLSLAQQVLDAKTGLPTNLGTAELRGLGADVLRQSLFSARMTNTSAVQGLRDAVTGILSGVDGKNSDTLADARLKLKALGKSLQYDPARGFPGEEKTPTILKPNTAGGFVKPGSKIPPAGPGELRDLYSTDRLNLQLKTQQNMAQGAAKNIWGNTPDAVDQYPAWELVRVEAREVPRGEIKRGKGVVEVPEDAWDTANGRWAAALDASGDDEARKIFAATGRMVARKDSDIWEKLGEGAGGYDDALGNDFEPFAFNSGMGRVEVASDEFEQLGGDADDVEPSDTDFGPDEVKLSKSRFDPDILQALKTAMDSGDLKFRVKVTVLPNTGTAIANGDLPGHEFHGNQYVTLADEKWTGTPKEMHARAEAVMKGFKSATNPQLGEVQFTRSGRHKTLFDKRTPHEFQSVQALPKLVEQGKVVSSLPDRKGRADILAVHKIEHGLKIGDDKYKAELTIRETKEGAKTAQKFYLHRIARES